MTFQISLTSILLLANALMLAIALLVIIRFRREARAQLDFWQSPIAAALMVERESGAPPESGNDPQRFVQSMMRLEHQMLLLRKDFMRNAVAESKAEAIAAPVQPIVQPIVQQPASLPIENAVRMARHGASVEELAERCGLNLGEARLMQKLHGKPRTTH